MNHVDRVYGAAEAGEERLRVLLASGLSIDSVDSYGRTALQLAACNGAAPVMRVLLAAGASVNTTDALYGRTALRMVAYGGHAAMVRMLAEARADLELADTDGWTALRVAAAQGHFEVLQVLVQAGAKLDTADRALGRTALQEAAAKGHTAAVELLVDSGANVNITNRHGQTALQMATEAGCRYALSRAGSHPIPAEEAEAMRLSRQHAFRAGDTWAGDARSGTVRQQRQKEEEGGDTAEISGAAAGLGLTLRLYAMYIELLAIDAEDKLDKAREALDWDLRERFQEDLTRFKAVLASCGVNGSEQAHGLALSVGVADDALRAQKVATFLSALDVHLQGLMDREDFDAAVAARGVFGEVRALSEGWGVHPGSRMGKAARATAAAAATSTREVPRHEHESKFSDGVVVLPDTLEFTEGPEVVYGSIRVSNFSRDPVAYRVRVSVRHIFVVPENEGCIPPNDEIDITVAMRPLSSFPHADLSRVKFAVETKAMPEGGNVKAFLSTHSGSLQKTSVLCKIHRLKDSRTAAADEDPSPFSLLSFERRDAADDKRMQRREDAKAEAEAEAALDAWAEEQRRKEEAEAAAEAKSARRRTKSREGGDGAGGFDAEAAAAAVGLTVPLYAQYVQILLMHARLRRLQAAEEKNIPLRRQLKVEIENHLSVLAACGEAEEEAKMGAETLAAAVDRFAVAVHERMMHLMKELDDDDQAELAEGVLLQVRALEDVSVASPGSTRASFSAGTSFGGSSSWERDRGAGDAMACSGEVAVGGRDDRLVGKVVLEAQRKWRHSSGAAHIALGVYHAAVGAPIRVAVKLSADEEAVTREHAAYQRVSVLDGFMRVYAVVRPSQIVFDPSDAASMRHRSHFGLVMDVGGRDLGTIVSSSPRPSQSMLVVYIEDVLRAVKALHDRGIAHMDIKPANFVHFSRNAEEHHIVCIDLDHAIDADTELTVEHARAGVTWPYVCPVFAKHARGAAPTGSPVVTAQQHDMWSLGATVIELIHGGFGLCQDCADIPAVQARLCALTQAEVNQLIDDWFKNHPRVRSLLRQLLNVDKPALRGTVEEAQRHLHDVAMNRTEIFGRILDRLDDLQSSMHARFDALDSSLDDAMRVAAVQSLRSDESGLSTLVELSQQLLAVLPRQVEGAGAMRSVETDVRQVVREVMADSMPGVVRDMGRELADSVLEALKDARSSDASAEVIVSMLSQLQAQVREVGDSVSAVQVDVATFRGENRDLSQRMLSALENFRVDTCGMLQTLIDDTHKVPTLMMLVPYKSSSMTGRLDPTNLLVTKCKLFFLCSHTLKMIPCGPKGTGYSIKQPRQWYKDAGPIFQVTFVLLAIAAVATMGIPLPGCSLAALTGKELVPESTAECMMMVAELIGDANVPMPSSGAGRAKEEQLAQWLKENERDLVAQEGRLQAYLAVNSVLEAQDPQLKHVGMVKRSAGGVTAWIEDSPDTIASFLRNGGARKSPAVGYSAPAAPAQSGRSAGGVSSRVADAKGNGGGRYGGLARFLGAD